MAGNIPHAQRFQHLAHAKDQYEGIPTTTVEQQSEDATAAYVSGISVLIMHGLTLVVVCGLLAKSSFREWVRQQNLHLFSLQM